jgi:hypothetical protein
VAPPHSPPARQAPECGDLLPGQLTCTGGTVRLAEVVPLGPVALDAGPVGPAGPGADRDEPAEREVATPTTLGILLRSASSIPMRRSWIGSSATWPSASKNWPRMSPTTPRSRSVRTSAAVS